MANLDFLKKLLSPDFTLSPMDSEDAKAGRDLLEEQRLREEDPMAFMPAEEGEEINTEPIQNRQLASQGDIKDIHSIPGSEMDRVPKIAAIPKIENAVLPETSKVNRYQELLDQYNSRNRNLGLVQAGNQIAQAIASGYGAKIGSGSEAIKTLQAQNLSPDKQIAAEDAAQMADPNSDVSKFYREQAYSLLKKLNPSQDYSNRLEGMSASQLQKLPGMKNLGSSERTNNRYVTIQEPDGTVRSKVINMETGDTVKDLGLAGYAYGSMIDPRTKEVMRLSKSDPKQGPSAVTGPRIPKKSEGEVVGEEVQGETQPKFANAAEAKRALDVYNRDLLDKDVDQFQTKIADEKRIISEIGAISDSSLGLATKNPNAAKTLGAQIAKILQGSRLTDADVQLYTGREGILNKVEDYASALATGTISDQQAKDIKETLATYNTALRKAMENRALQAADTVAQNFPSESGVTGQDIAPLYYRDEKITSNSTGEVRRKTADGKIAIFDAKTKKFIRYEKE